MLVIKILVLTILLTILVQDLKNRTVYWVVFPVLAMLFIIMDLSSHLTVKRSCQTVLLNISFLTLQFLIVSIYFSAKNRRWVNITSGLLGWGDVLFLLSIAFYLSVLNFLFFYIFSLMAVLLAWGIWQLLSRKKSRHIPLAGLQALIFILFLAGAWWFKFFDLTDDAWLQSLIMK